MKMFRGYFVRKATKEPSRKWKIIKRCVISTVLVGGITYGLATFTNIPVLSTMRTIWIETAMTTGEHKWLATKFFPKFVVEEVMASKHIDDNKVVITNLIQDDKSNRTISGNSEFVLGETKDYVKPKRSDDILGQDDLGSEDKFGNKVLVNDIEQGLVIVEIKSAKYKGKLVMVDDPSRIFVKHTNKKEVRGQFIKDYLKEYDAVLGINGNGFNDEGGSGKGGEILGYSLSEGKEWGSGARDSYITIGFDNKNRLVAGRMLDWSIYNIRDAVQFEPLLISHGEVMVNGSAGYGIQPRTVVGQREDGVVLLMVVDGRQPGYSIGITVGEAAEILHQYGAITAAACDGGSSSIMAYNGELITRPSTPLKKTGRYLPNAILVRKK